MKVAGKMPLAEEVGRDVVPAPSQSPRPDRLNRVLIGAAIILAMALITIVVDLLLQPSSRQPSSPALGAVQTPYPPAASPVAGTPLSLEAAVTALPPCTAPSDWNVHKVKSGDTLYSLAQRYGSDVATLKKVNCLDSDTIYVGQELAVPGPDSQTTWVYAPTATATPSPSETAEPTIEIPAAVDLPLPPTPAVQTAFQINIPNDYLHIVLLGTDKRHFGPHRSTYRTDAIIVVSVNLKDNTVRLLHIPRDLWVYIPGHGENRINTAEIWGELDEAGSGPDRVKQTIYYSLGIPVHYYAQVDWQGFIDIIDALGGLDIDVDCPLPELGLEPGIHHMDGEQALYYAQSRETTDDFDRGRRQRKVLTALWDQALSASIIPKLPKLWMTLSDSFLTDLTLDQIINLAYVGLQLEPQRIINRAIDQKYVEDWITPQGSWVLLPREDKLREMLEEYYAPADTERLDTAQRVRVEVLSGWNRYQADQLAAAALHREGFKIVNSGEAGYRNHRLTQILVYKGDPSAGERIANELLVPLTAVQDLTAIPEPPDPSSRVDVRVILGEDYDPCQRR